MTEAGRWSRFRKSRLFGVLAVYGGAAWVILQIVDILQNSLQLPKWVGAVTLLLLVIGLFVVLATAWVQSHPLSDRREAAEEVPGSWEVGLGDLKESVSEGRLPHLTWGRALLGGAVAFSLLFGFLGLWVVIQDRGETFNPAEAVGSGAAAPAIAVLPFSVSGEGLDEWREGTVNLLSTNLDGAAGLRAIDSRTVLAQWDRQMGDGSDGDRETALQIARATGARWALLGSAVSIGPRVRLTADVIDLQTGTGVGQVRAEGPPDSVLVLVDGLTVDVLRELLGAAQADLEPISLAAVTTASIPALRAFLEGEAAHRRSEFTAAVDAYERAVADDSSFALAWDRLATALAWDDSFEFYERILDALGRAWALRDRLPERRARVVEVAYGRITGDTSTLEKALALVKRYPDDPETWYQLGEAYFHLPPTHLSTLDDQTRTFERAIELDPSFAPYRIHHLELAFRSGDSAAAAARLGEYSRLAGEDLWTAGETVRFGLAFGDSATHARTVEGLGTVPTEVLSYVLMTGIDLRYSQVREEAAAALEARGDLALEDRIWRMIAFAERGQLSRVWALLPQIPLPQVVPFAAADPVATRFPVPADIVELVLEAESETERIPFLGIIDAADGFRAIVATAAGRPAEYEARLEALSRAREQALADGDSTFARRAKAADLLARASRAVREEGIDVALPLARRANALEPIPWFMGEFLMLAGEAKEAIPYLRYSWDSPWAWYLLGQAYEQEGEPALARDAYEVFVTAWADADPELQPSVDDARGRLVALIKDLD